MEENGSGGNSLSERKSKMKSRIEALIAKTSSAQKRTVLQRELAERMKVADRRIRLKEIADDLLLLEQNVSEDTRLLTEGDTEAEVRIAEATQLRSDIIAEAVSDGLTPDEIEVWLEGAPYYRRAEAASTEREIYDVAVSLKKDGVLKQISRAEFERIAATNGYIRGEQLKGVHGDKHDTAAARSNTTPVFKVECSGDHRHFAPVSGRHRKLSEAILIMWDKIAREHWQVGQQEVLEHIAVDKTLEQLILGDEPGTAKAEYRLREKRSQGRLAPPLESFPPAQRYIVYFRSNREELTVVHVIAERSNIPNLLAECEGRSFFFDPDKLRPNLISLTPNLRRFVIRVLEADGWRHPDWDYSRSGKQNVELKDDQASIVIPIEVPISNPVLPSDVIDKIMKGDRNGAKGRNGRKAHPRENGQYREDKDGTHAE